MKPGRELDALIAEKIFSCKIIRHKDYGPLCGCELIKNGFPPHGWIMHRGFRLFTEETGINFYSTKISPAWQVVEKTGILRDYLLYQLHDGWSLQDHSERTFCIGDTAPHVICLAALKAVEYSGSKAETK